jgi:hypothetical protein
VEHYAGIDVSLELSSVCVVDGRGKIVKEAKVSSEPEALVCFFKELGVPMNRIGNTLYATDFDESLKKVAKTMMIIAGDGKANVLECHHSTFGIGRTQKLARRLANF